MSLVRGGEDLKNKTPTNYVSGANHLISSNCSSYELMITSNRGIKGMEGIEEGELWVSFI
jgi:hypothetical protein